jgi:hypothetical protein
MRRAAAVLLLVAVAVVGLRAGGTFSSKGSTSFLGVSEHAMFWILAGTEMVLAIAGLILMVARLMMIRSGAVVYVPRKRRSIWWILLLPIMVYGLTKTLALLRSHGFGPHRTVLGAGGGARPIGHAPPGSPWPVLVLFAVVALTAGVLTAYRRRRSAPVSFTDPVPEDEPLAEALAVGAQVLSEEPDPRAAIIGCYAAMERSLAEAGTPVQAADTPAEVLARATAGGRVRSGPAATLTGLFRTARYSSHPVTEAGRATALAALAEVRADLAAEPVRAS